MSLTRAIAHNTAIQVAGKIASTILGLVAIAIMFRYLGVEHFGWYVTASGFLQFIGIMSDFGFTVTVSNMLAEDQFPSQATVETAFTWRLLTSALFNGLAPLLILLFPYPTEIKLAVAILALSFFTTALNQVFIGYYRQKLQLAVVTIGEIASRVVLVAGTALVAMGHFGFLPIMAAITVAAFVGTVILWFYVRPLRLNFNKEISAVLFQKMWPTAISVICNACYLQADRVILPLYVSQSAVGLYGASYRVLDIVIQVAAIVMGIIMPLITGAWAKNNLTAFKQRYQMGFDVLVILLLPMVTGIFVLSEPILHFIAGKNFSEGGLYLRYLSLSIFGTCFGMIFGHITLAINRQKEALWIYGSDAVLSLIGYFYFIAHYGVWGAIGVTLFSELYAGIGLTVLTIRYSRVTPRLTTFFKTSLASILMGAVIYQLQNWPVVLTTLFGAVVYAILLIILRAVSLATVREVLGMKKVAEIS